MIEVGPHIPGGRVRSLVYDDIPPVYLLRRPPRLAGLGGEGGDGDEDLLLPAALPGLRLRFVLLGVALHALLHGVIGHALKGGGLLETDEHVRHAVPSLLLVSRCRGLLDLARVELEGRDDRREVLLPRADAVEDIAQIDRGCPDRPGELRLRHVLIGERLDDELPEGGEASLAVFHRCPPFSVVVLRVASGPGPSRLEALPVFVDCVVLEVHRPKRREVAPELLLHDLGRVAVQHVQRLVGGPGHAEDVQEDPAIVLGTIRLEEHPQRVHLPGPLRLHGPGPVREVLEGLPLHAEGLGGLRLLPGEPPQVDLDVPVREHPQRVQGLLEAVELVRRRLRVHLGVELALDLGLELRLPSLDEHLREDLLLGEGVVPVDDDGVAGRRVVDVPLRVQAPGLFDRDLEGVRVVVLHLAPVEVQVPGVDLRVDDPEGPEAGVLRLLPLIEADDEVAVDFLDLSHGLLLLPALPSSDPGRSAPG